MGFFFENHRQFPQLHSGAHRKTAPVVGAPALVCHVGLWAPVEVVVTPSETDASFNANDRAERSDPNDEARQKRKEKVDDYLIFLYKKLKSYPGFHTPNYQTIKYKRYLPLFQKIINDNGDEVTNYPQGNADDYQVIIYQFDWHHIATTLRFELHTEYFTITALLDLAGEIAEAEITELCRTDETFNFFYGNFCRLKDSIGSTPDAFDDRYDPKTTEYREVHQNLYHAAWKKFDHQVLFNPVFYRFFHGVFVDFRALILSGPSNSEAEHDVVEFYAPFTRQKRNKPTAPSSTPSPGWAWKSIRDFYFFLTDEDRVDLKKYELTASRMLGGRVLYVSALGAQPSILRSQNDRTPLLYFLHSNTQNTWQIGRLIDRINHLGTVRVAAIMHVEELRKSGQKLRAVEQKIETTQQFVLAEETKIAARSHKPLTPPYSPDSEAADDDDNTDQHKKFLEQLRRNLNEIQLEMVHLKSGFDGGLEYRVERSRYYVKQFRDSVPPLRIRRVEGYQPYDVFVQRRLGAVFDYIDRLGLRFERVQRDIETLYEYIQTHSSLVVELDIDKRNKKIERLQQTGELFLFIILAPYYLSSVLSHLLGTQHSGSEDGFFRISFDQVIWMLGIAFGISLLVYEAEWRQAIHKLGVLRSSGKKRRRRVKLLWVFAIAATSLVVEQFAVSMLDSCWPSCSLRSAIYTPSP